MQRLSDNLCVDFMGDCKTLLPSTFPDFIGVCVETSSSNALAKVDEGDAARIGILALPHELSLVVVATHCDQIGARSDRLDGAGQIVVAYIVVTRSRTVESHVLETGD